ncbi:MAG: glycosyltransferase family 2 protein [Bacteroidaceae bacterium]|nr:glycosyltransferase family 2 protein [Bacteroidaceae bacterium]
MPISAVVNTYNAEKHLEQVLDALKDFDEIVVCDMESTDNTIGIAKKYGCKIVTFPKGNITIVEPARNFAIQQASHEWVLVVDADEIITPELRDYLYKRIEQPECPTGMFISRLNMYLGQHEKERFATDFQLRFMKRDKVDWPPTIHAVPRIDGTIEKAPLQFKIMHLADETIQQFINKANTYSDNEVVRKAHKKYGIVALIYRPLWSFFRTYFIKGEILQGRRGLIKAYMNATYQVFVVTKMMEKAIRANKEK